MNLHVLHDCQTLAHLTGRAPLPCDGIISRLGKTDQIAAAWIEGNPLAPDFIADVDQLCPRLLMRSGTLANTLFAQDPRNWLKPGRAALDAFTQRVAPVLQAANRTICLRLHARHVLSDPQGALRFLLDHKDEPFELALCPAEMITAQMLDHVEDHLARMFESLAPRAALIMLGDLQMSEDGCGESVPLGEGILPQNLVLSLVKEHVPATTPIVLAPQKLALQMAWLQCEASQSL